MQYPNNLLIILRRIRVVLIPATVLVSSGFAQIEMVLPRSNYGAQIVCHVGYCFEYSEEHEQSYWVAYLLKATNLSRKIVKRTNNYREDPAVVTQTANGSDYKGSGYDRGHLAPAAIFRHDSLEMSESFYYSNISPQHPQLNRQGWNDLELSVRTWTQNEGELFVVSGPVLSRNLPTIGKNNVSVPTMFYKVILDYRGDKKAVGFLVPNKKIDKALIEYAVPVDSIERLTGLDFFHHLPDSTENRLEAIVRKNDWPIVTNKKYRDQKRK